MDSTEVVNELNNILMQFETSLAYADMGDDDAIEAQADNEHAEKALKIAIAAIRIVEGLENAIHQELKNFIVKDTYTRGKNAGLRKVLVMIDDIKSAQEN